MLSRIRITHEDINTERRQQSRKRTSDPPKPNYPHSPAEERLTFTNLCVRSNYSVAHLTRVVRNSSHECQRQRQRHLSDASCHRIRSVCNSHELKNLLRNTRLNLATAMSNQLHSRFL